MQNDKNYSEILAQITTKDDWNKINSDLSVVETSLYVPGSNLDISASVSKALEKEKDKKNFIANLRLELQKIKFLELTLSSSPSQKMLNEIINWVNSHVTDENLALDIKVDESIIAGAIISFNGKYLDTSLKTKLKRELQNYV